MDFEKMILNYLKSVYEEIKYNNQFRQKKRNLFEYTYRMMINKNILSNLEDLKKIKQDIDEIKRKI